MALVAPGLFSANGNGQGVAAATAIRVTPDSTQVPIPVFQCGPAPGSCAPVPLDWGGANNRVFLNLYGTGIRNRSSLANVRCSMGGTDAPVLFAGAQGGFAGLDQVNVEVPGSLRGRGDVSVVLTVDGASSNPVTIYVQ
jgi:uncharacterized protein (TIGR03437 family)